MAIEVNCRYLEATKIRCGFSILVIQHLARSIEDPNCCRRITKVRSAGLILRKHPRRPHFLDRAVRRFLIVCSPDCSTHHSGDRVEFRRRAVRRPAPSVGWSRHQGVFRWFGHSISTACVLS
jgi:hypothetical protein